MERRHFLFLSFPLARTGLKFSMKAMTVRMRSRRFRTWPERFRAEPFARPIYLKINALGVKGLGEVAMVGVAPAIANAIHHATGKRLTRLPFRVEHVLQEG
ncbi:hypothetical protein [Sphingomonas sp. S2-65]|uniref:hypothetical protein n=1 Tax=Sphingomonas sp. S2-65 TaxID=2903960 RepID=UPI001F3CE4AD|nr:hypothetical protein [Sphingomonas sp. S2-65]UYY57246.1 hypothetical protein LZ586_11165 [Sphingomonas sp. S2-65]